ncbi:MAG: hypothetical protein K2X81_28935, partial [Candidatus Obscuribacterales bacterium]|nr:hypothetical protein [Candidatus Obscuribacterales bacterium]
TSIATNMASAITADTNLQAIAVSATASGTVVFINSGSKLLTTYASSTSGGATETLSLASSTSANQYGYNNLNELTSVAAGGSTRFEGTANKALKSATVNSNAATLPDSQKFVGNATLNSGANTIPASVTDGTNTTKTSSYRVSTKGSVSSSPTFDANGNLTSDGTNTYEWDAENRLVKISYPGMNNYSAFTFDSLGRNTEILETVSGALTETRMFVWSKDKRREERNGSGTVTKKFFTQGQAIATNVFFYSLDHLGSTREMTTNLGEVKAEYGFSPYGEFTKTDGTIDTAFRYAGYFVHSRSGLNLTRTRAYSAGMGRWISRDMVGFNTFGYVENAPTLGTDPLGLWNEPSNGYSGWHPGEAMYWDPISGNRNQVTNYLRAALPANGISNNSPLSSCMLNYTKHSLAAAATSAGLGGGHLGTAAAMLGGFTVEVWELAGNSLGTYASLAALTEPGTPSAHTNKIKALTRNSNSLGQSLSDDTLNDLVADMAGALAGSEMESGKWGNLLDKLFEKARCFCERKNKK